MACPTSKDPRGVTLIELLIALAISAILTTAIYRLFVSHQASHARQEQVADMQQNARVGVNQMIREIRMAGFGGKGNNLPGVNDIITVYKNLNGFTHIVNPAPNVTVEGITHDRITVLAAYDAVSTLAAPASAGDTSVTIHGAAPFDADKKKFLCLRGEYLYTVKNVAGNTVDLGDPGGLREAHSQGSNVFMVKAITYGLRMDPSDGVTPLLIRNENISGGQQGVAENIESLRFRYLLADGSETDAPADPTQIRGVRIMLTARTRMIDTQLKEPGGYLRRTINTYVDLRNLR